jgi:mevalonate kinase
MKIHIPGKTFLLGEYAVLQGGTAVIACTQPFFELSAEKLPPLQKGLAKRGILGLYRDIPFHPDSPAGKFILDHSETFDSLILTWLSPYSEGGFGGSTAEFLSCFRLYHHLTQQTFTQENLYKTYLKYAYNHQGIPPSGADLMAQNQKAGLVYFQSPTLSLHSFSWPFDDISLLLFKTPAKLPTHQHLQTLKNLPDCKMLSALSLQGYNALQQGDKQGLIKAINDYALTLAQLNLTAESTQQLLNQIKQHPACLATKGCGALGADVIAVLVFIEHEKDFIHWCQKHQLNHSGKLSPPV